MAYLFLDTASTLHCGILDDKFHWIDYISTEILRSSGQVHGILDQLMTKHQLSWQDIAGLIVSSGPGSYTGMRVSEGIAQILELDGVAVFSFYHFDLLADFGLSGYWVSEAFKGEFFCYNSKTKSSELLRLEDLLQKLADRDDLYALDDQVRGIDLIFKSTRSLIHDKGKEFFHKLITEQRREVPFYYRPEQVEFTLKSKK